MEPLINKEAHRKYEILERITAGVVLLGPEVKSIKNGRLQIRGSYVKIIGNEFYWVNASIPQYPYAHIDNYNPERSRKLLVTKRELTRLLVKLRERGNLTLIPLKCYNQRGLIKLEIALSKGKKAHDIKALEKAREIDRKDKQHMKEYLKG